MALATSHLTSLAGAFAGQLWACASYGLVSVSLTITQKTVFHHFSFPYPNSVTLLQILTSIVIMHGLRGAGIIKFDALSRQNVRTVHALPLPLFGRRLGARKGSRKPQRGLTAVRSSHFLQCNNASSAIALPASQLCRLVFVASRPTQNSEGCEHCAEESPLVVSARVL
jgi:hypothetical protein